MVFHMISEVYTDCDKCHHQNTMKKLLTTPLKTISPQKEPTSVGDITKEYIMANKEILEEEKQKARSESYEPS